MTKYSFKNDYSEGFHPQLIKSLSESNFEQQQGYGEDIYCEKAKTAIKAKTGDKNSEIYFVSGGTQANTVVISSALRPYEGVIAATTGHINVHETGAIEATGHKIILIPSVNGKINTKDIEKICELAEDHHMVKPAMVYISNSTELGSIYKKEELSKISECCKKNNLLLFLDGARLGSALCAAENDITLADLALFCDVFYIVPLRKHHISKKRTFGWVLSYQQLHEKSVNNCQTFHFSVVI